MLTLHIPAQKGFDDEKRLFIEIKDTTLYLEHSLVSLRKWEMKWHIPFLNMEQDKTAEQWIDYVRCMAINKGNVDDNVFKYMSGENLSKIIKYIEDPMTATWFSEKEMKQTGRRNKEVITAEIIYYWMIELGIPIEFEKWHLNSLMTLIRVINLKRNPKKMSKREEAMQRSALNAQRKARSRSKG